MTAGNRLDRQGTWLMAGSFLFLAMVGSVVGWQAVRTPRLDPVTLCDPNRPLSGEVVILLDATDPLTLAQQARVTEWLREFELTELRKNERVSLWVLGADEADDLRQDFCRCYPGRETDPILHNPAMITAACESLFDAPLRRAMATAAVAKPARSSRILEAIRELSEQPELTGSSCPRRLFVISDLEQNTPELSLYRAVPDFVAFRRTPLLRSVRADLREMSVDVLYLARPGRSPVEAARIRAFWRNYLTACGAVSVRFSRF